MTRKRHTPPHRGRRNVKIGTINLEYDGSVLEETLLDRFEPHVVSFQQGNRVNLRKVDGYRTIRAGRSYEGKGVGALVRRDVKVLKVRRLKMRQKWTGPKAGKRHDPRQYVAVLCEYRKARFWVLCVHFPFGYGPQNESEQTVKRFLRRHPNYPVFVAGDWNKGDREVEAIAREVDADYHLVGKVDGVLVRGASLLVSHRRLAPTGRKWHGIGVVKLSVPTHNIKENR